MCTASQEKESEKEGWGWRVEGQPLWMRVQTLVLADIQAGAVSLPVAPVPFPARTGDRSLGLGYSD